MRFNNRVVNFGDTHVTTHLSDDQLMESLRAGRRRPPSRRLPAVQDALRRARALAAADARSGRRRSRQRVHAPNGFTISAIASCGASSVTTTRPKSWHFRISACRRTPLSIAYSARRAAGSRAPRPPVSPRACSSASRWIAASFGRSIGAVQQSKSNTSLALQATADDQFFIDIDEALIGSRVREMRPDLSAIDIMTTPLEIREVELRSRMRQ